MFASYVLECRELLVRLFPLVDQLKLHVEKTSGFVFYQEGSEGALQGQQAREAISHHLGEMHYPGIEDIGIEPSPRFMTVAVHADTLPLLQAVNDAKKALQLWHEALARTQPNSYAAAQMNRAVLKRADEPLLNLQMAERSIICLAGPPVRLSWHYNTTSNSRRKMLGDVLVALEKLADKLPEYRAGDIETARNSLASLPLDTPVAYRPSKPVTHLKCQYRYLNLEDGPQRGVCYAKNPIFYPETPFAPPPAISLPAEVQGRKPRGGAGRPSIISDKQVTPLLPNWFWYKSTE
jgi:hypothetical protein